MAGAVVPGKIAFLVNTAPLRDQERYQEYYRQICMAIIRLLLFLCSFPRRKTTANLRWCYRLYDSEKSRPTVTVGLRTESFLEFNSFTLEKFFSELKAHMCPEQNTSTSLNASTNQPVHSRVLASALGSLVLQLPWDKPELHSPARYSRIASGTSRSQQRSKPTDPSSNRDNLVFVVSDCPHSTEDLAAFSSHSVLIPSTQPKGGGSAVKGVFLSDDLSSQLKKCGIALHWVDTAPSQGKTQLDYAGLAALSVILQSEEGGILPVSSLILSLEGESLPPEPLEGQPLPSADTEGQSLSVQQLQKCRDIATVAMESNAHLQSPVNSDIKQTRNPLVCHAVPPSTWIRSKLQPGRLSTQTRRKKGEMGKRQIRLPLFNPDGASICFLEGSALAPLNPKEAQSHSKLTMSLRSSSSKDQTRVKQAQRLQAAQEANSPEIPMQLSITSVQPTEGQSTSEAPPATPSVAVVLAVLPDHEVPFSWLHQTEAYICGGYCYRQLEDESSATSGRETAASGDTPGVVLEDCAQQVKVVTDAVWCDSSEGEVSESGTTGEATSASCDAVPTNAPTNNGEVPSGSTFRAAFSNPLRELAVVVEKSPISQGALPKEHGFAPRLLSFEDKCLNADPSPCPGQEKPAEVTLQCGDVPAPLPPLLLSPVASSMSPLLDLKRDQATDCSCEEKSTVKEGGGLRWAPTSINSRTFQGLCLLLSKRQLVAVLGLVGAGVHQRVSYALLQPITSLRAALTHIKPTKGMKLLEVLRRVGRHPYSAGASVGLGCHGDAGNGVVSLAASELEIHANLSLLFPRRPQTTSVTEDLLQRHVDTIVSSSLSHGVAYCLLPWFSLHPQRGINKAVLQLTHNSRPLSRQTLSSLSCSPALVALKRAYSCCSVRGGEDCGVRGTDTSLPTTVGDTDGQTERKEGEQNESEKTSPPQLVAEVVERESVQPPTLESSVVPTDTDTVLCVCECSSVEEVVARSREVYSQLLLDKSEPDTLQRAAHKHFCWLQCQLDSLGAPLASFLVEHVLQTCTTLKEKYTSQLGPPPSVTIDSLLARELFLQIILYLEAVSAGATEGLDSTSQIVSMCIASLPFTEVSPMGKLFQKVILPSYGVSCLSVLTDVYDELMWPLPPSLGGDDVQSSFPEADALVATEETQGTELSHDSHMSNMSPLEEYGAPRAPASTGSVKSAPLARQHSFHHTAGANKEIALATGKGRNKRKAKSRKAKPKTSPRMAASTVSVKPLVEDGQLSVNKVKRSLFTRSHSTSEATLLREGVTSAATSPDCTVKKRTRSDENDVFSTPKRRRFQRNSTIAWDISCVKETPLKKQVANPLKLKLQRARSKVNVSPDVMSSVAETPKRSRLFYTQLPKCASQRRVQSPLAEGDHFVKKDPSPETLKALLHGRLALRGRRATQSQNSDPQVERLLTDIIKESPPKNSSLDQSPSEDPLVIACTPLRSSMPKQSLLLDTPLRAGADVGRMVDMGCNSGAAAGSTAVIGSSPRGEAFFLESVNVVGRTDPSVSGGQESVSLTGFTTPVRQPPTALGSWSTVLQRTTDSPDLFVHSPCSGPGLFSDSPAARTDSPTPTATNSHWSSPKLTQFRREAPDISMETDSHIAFMMSTPPRSRNALPTSFHGLFPKAE